MNTPEQGFDNPELLERVGGLMDRGYTVYFGELATAALSTARTVPDTYYALVMRGSEHEEQINIANHVYAAARMVQQVRRDIYFMPDEPFSPIERFTEKAVLHDSNVRTGDTADMALDKATKTLVESEKLVVPDRFKFVRPGRLRQAHDDCHRRRRRR